MISWRASHADVKPKHELSRVNNWIKRQEHIKITIGCKIMVPWIYIKMWIGGWCFSIFPYVATVGVNANPSKIVPNSSL